MGTPRRARMDVSKPPLLHLSVSRHHPARSSSPLSNSSSGPSPSYDIPPTTNTPSPHQSDSPRQRRLSFGSSQAQQQQQQQQQQQPTSVTRSVLASSSIQVAVAEDLLQPDVLKRTASVPCIRLVPGGGPPGPNPSSGAPHAHYSSPSNLQPRVQLEQEAVAGSPPGTSSLAMGAGRFRSVPTPHHGPHGQHGPARGQPAVLLSSAGRPGSSRPAPGAGASMMERVLRPTLRSSLLTSPSDLPLSYLGDRWARGAVASWG